MYKGEEICHLPLYPLKREKGQPGEYFTFTGFEKRPGPFWPAGGRVRAGQKGPGMLPGLKHSYTASRDIRLRGFWILVNPKPDP